MPDYDENNIFARILRKELPNKTVLETDHTLVFEDIRPQAPVHLLVIPKGAYTSFEDFSARAPEAELVDFMRTAARAAELAGVTPDQQGNGFRLIANSGENAHQEVPHFHFHILGGRPLGALLAADRTA